MSISSDFRRITKRLDDVLAAAFALDHGTRKRPKARRAALGTGLSKLEQKVLLQLRGTLHPTVVELAAVAAGTSWPQMPVSAFLSRLDLLGRYPKALARQQRASAHEIDGLLLATSGPTAHLAASGASLHLIVAGRATRFASVQAFLAFMEKEIDARAEQAEQAEQALPTAGSTAAAEASSAAAIAAARRGRAARGRRAR